MEALFEKKDILGPLPTGFGKSLIYQLFPKIHLLVNGGERCSVIAVSMVSVLKAITEKRVIELDEWELRLQRFARVRRLMRKYWKGNMR